MDRPLCPNCREQLSFAELGLDGVWSCIYCEGTWLSSAEVAAICERNMVVEPNWEGLLGARRLSEKPLLCPTCQTCSFVTFPVNELAAHSCRECHSIYFEKGTLNSLVPTVGLGASGPEVLAKNIAAATVYLVPLLHVHP